MLRVSLSQNTQEINHWSAGGFASKKDDEQKVYRPQEDEAKCLLAFLGDVFCEFFRTLPNKTKPPINLASDKNQTELLVSIQLNGHLVPCPLILEMIEATFSQKHKWLSVFLCLTKPVEQGI